MHLTVISPGRLCCPVHTILNSLLIKPTLNDLILTSSSFSVATAADKVNDQIWWPKWDVWKRRDCKGGVQAGVNIPIAERDIIGFCINVGLLEPLIFASILSPPVYRHLFLSKTFAFYPLIPPHYPLSCHFHTAHPDGGLPGTNLPRRIMKPVQGQGRWPGGDTSLPRPGAAAGRSNPTSKEWWLPSCRRA